VTLEAVSARTGVPLHRASWQGTAVSMSSQSVDPSQWLTFADVARRLGVSPNRVRNLVRDRHLLALGPDGARELMVPEEFLLVDQVVPGLPGTLTLLADDGFTDDEAYAWLTTDDPSLPGRPLDALRENRGTEVRRRAQALG
jgi:transcriptional regulator with XRE-family HTH domain